MDLVKIIVGSSFSDISMSAVADKSAMDYIAEFVNKTHAMTYGFSTDDEYS